MLGTRRTNQQPDNCSLSPERGTDQVRELAATIERQSGRTPDFRFYPAGHVFVNDANLIGTYDPEQAAAAWDATVRFLREQLVVPQHG
jgi:dienelactone hydrolase